MKTNIYYIDGIDKLAIDYLQSDKFKDRLKQISLEPNLITYKTATITASKFSRDTYGMLFLMTQQQKDRWIAQSKKDFLPEGKSFVMEDFSKLEDIIQKVFEVPYDEKLSALKHLDSDDSIVTDIPDEVAPTPRPVSVGAKDTGSTIPSRGTITSTPEPKLKDLTPEERQHKIDSFFNDERDRKVDMRVGTEKAGKIMYTDDLKVRHIGITKQDKFNLLVYEGTDGNSKAVQQFMDTAGFEVSASSEIQNIERYKTKIKDLIKQLQQLKVKYLEYKSPKQIDELTNAYIEIQDKYEVLTNKYEELIKNGDPNTKKALTMLEKTHAKLEGELQKARQDNQNLFSNNKKLLEQNKQLAVDKKNLDIEFADYKNKQAGKMNSIISKDREQYIQENISLSTNNRKLREDIKKKDTHIRDMERKQLEMQRGIYDSEPKQSMLEYNKRFANITAYVSVNAEAHELFYSSIITKPEFTLGKTTLIDLGKSSKLLDYFNMHKVTNPYLLVNGAKTLKESLSTVKSINGEVILDGVTTSSHGSNRKMFSAPSWGTFLENLNQRKSILYLGNIEDNSVYNFVSEIQKQRNMFKIIVILGSDTTKNNLFNLEGLRSKGLFFAGIQGLQYKTLPINLRYTR